MRDNYHDEEVLVEPGFDPIEVLSEFFERHYCPGEIKEESYADMMYVSEPSNFIQEMAPWTKAEAMCFVCGTSGDLRYLEGDKQAQVRSLCNCCGS